jgi:nicotinate phosphoribosyltransferase
MTHSPLLTDLYQLTMAAAYWKCGRADDEAVFHLFFRRPPFGGGYAIAAGLADALEWVRNFRFEEADLLYLQCLTGRDGTPLFEPPFLRYLARLELTVDIDALPEGTVVFGQEPLLRVRGPLLQAQLLETALLCILNFQTLVATKAARVCEAARGESVLEFGLRRAQGPDGALSASRAAFIGGCAATSNVLAGRRFGIPVRGTHAHAWVMSFDSEREAFQAYARAMPHNSVFLVDTYDTPRGVREAIEAGRWLRDQGHSLGGIRLDGGDLAQLSIAARALLDEAGFPDAAIVAGNDLDEHQIENLKLQGARISVWGVGTRLVTAHDQPALGGVYKLGALRRPGGQWEPRIKLSDQPIKISNPGILQLRRYRTEDGFIGDVIHDVSAGPASITSAVDIEDSGHVWNPPADATPEDLLVPVLRGGDVASADDSLSTIQTRARDQLAQLPAATRRFANPQPYFVGLDRDLHETRQRLIAAARDATNR